MESAKQPTCTQCHYLIRNDVPQEFLRCGYTYLSLPPGQRRPSRLDTYPVVSGDDFCDQWRLWDSARI